MTYHAHLTEEHARFLHSVLDREEAEIARLITRAFGHLPQDPKLGHASSHTPKLVLADYLADNAQAPAMVHRGLYKGYTDVLGNDKWGDCGDAMTLHGIEAMRHAAGTPVPPFLTADALQLYSDVSGFDESAGAPGSNPTDTGTDNDKLVDYWQGTGVSCAADQSVHTIAGSVAVDSTSDVECQIAIYEFAALFCAWALPITAQGQRTWNVAGDGKTGSSAPASWGYHDTVSTAYSGAELDTDSWGVRIPGTGPFRRIYAAGFFAVASKDMLGRRGVSPSGLDWTALSADLAKL